MTTPVPATCPECGCTVLLVKGQPSGCLDCRITKEQLQLLLNDGRGMSKGDILQILEDIITFRYQRKEDDTVDG